MEYNGQKIKEEKKIFRVSAQTRRGNRIDIRYQHMSARTRTRCAHRNEPSRAMLGSGAHV